MTFGFILRVFLRDFVERLAFLFEAELVESAKDDLLLLGRKIKTWIF